jgi:hypothetical protein
MKTGFNSNIRKGFYAIKLLGIAVFVIGVGNLLSVHAQEAGNDHYRVSTILIGGRSIDELIINGPPTPPPGYELERTVVDLSAPDLKTAAHSLTVPAFNWVFGCSSVSGAMIAGYYDRNGFPNMYAGPTNGGVMPLDNSSWPTWSDGDATYPNLPLAGSHQGVDGRSTRGSIDDYWVKYESTAQDPYLTGSWTQHTWGDAIGDYMKTSQSAFNNKDGSSAFYTYTSSPAQLTCADMVVSEIHTRDATYGRKLFYEARGYTVTDCYNQKTDNNGGGFTLALYKSEIDAGRPVMINLLGHTIVGVGYDDASNTIYIHDTWDYSDHSMPWGGSYQGMAMQSVSIVNLQAPTTGSVKKHLPMITKPTPPPGSFSKSAPANGATSQPANPSLSWGASSGATSFEYCIDTTNNSACDAAWISTAASTSVGLTGLTPATSYFWQARAINASGITEANGGTWWTFTTAGAPAGPTPGYWESDYSYDAFYVNTSSSAVKNFSVKISVEGCGNYTITRTTDVPITSNQFSFSGPFYVSSGTFTSATTATVTYGLTDFPITDCGYITGGPWTEPFSWLNSSQPSVMPAYVTGPIPVNSTSSLKAKSVVVTPVR